MTGDQSAEAAARRSSAMAYVCAIEALLAFQRARGAVRLFDGEEFDASIVTLDLPSRDVLEKRLQTGRARLAKTGTEQAGERP